MPPEIFLLLKAAPKTVLARKDLTAIRELPSSVPLVPLPRDQARLYLLQSGKAVLRFPQMQVDSRLSLRQAPQGREGPRVRHRQTAPAKWKNSLSGVRHFRNNCPSVG